MTQKELTAAMAIFVGFYNSGPFAKIAVDTYMSNSMKIMNHEDYVHFNEVYEKFKRLAESMER